VSELYHYNPHGIVQFVSCQIQRRIRLVPVPHSTKYMYKSSQQLSVPVHQKHTLRVTSTCNNHSASLNEINFVPRNQHIQMYLVKSYQLAFTFNGRDGTVFFINWFFFHLLRLFVLTPMSTVFLFSDTKKHIHQQ